MKLRTLVLHHFDGATRAGDIQVLQLQIEITATQGEARYDTEPKKAAEETDRIQNWDPRTNEMKTRCGQREDQDATTHTLADHRSRVVAA